jgi:REP element-mobilizing transposase RayT
MPRQRRIEYPDAVYHVMARGDRREEIVVDDHDRDGFEETLKEAVEKSGWIVFAWVLMSNHYHLVFKTPEPNLVKGMTWLQNTWTRRFNSRHRLWGHLFGGRYKAIPVEEGEYLTQLIHYVHLNPVRAGLVGRQDKIEGYRWSSLIDYTKPRRSRRGWVSVERGLAHMGLPDTASGRRRLSEWTEMLVSWRKPMEAGVAAEEGQSLQSTLRRGWYFGGEEFRERLVSLLAKTGAGAPAASRAKGYSGAQNLDHGIREAERICSVAEEVFDLDRDDWARLGKGDWRKGLVAGMIRDRALVPNRWVSERLTMGAVGGVSRTIAEARRQAESIRKIRTMARNLERMSSSSD